MQDVLVLVTERCDYRRLLWAGEEIAATEGRPLKVVGVRPRSAIKEDNGEMLEKLFWLTRSVDAEMTVYYNDDPASIAIRHIKQHHARRMVTDLPVTAKDTETIGRIRSACPDMQMQFVDDRGVLSGYPTMLELARTEAAYA